MKINLKTFLLGHISGIPIRIHYSWIPVFLFYTWAISARYLPRQGLELEWWRYWMLGLVTTSLLFVSVLIHEVSHSIMAKVEGLGTGEITLYMFGGLATLEGQPSRPSSEFKIAIAGPAASFLLGAFFFLMHQALVHGTTHLGAAQVLRHLGIVNWLLAGFNILPGLPLDGGRILRAALWRLNRNYREATRQAVRAGLTISLALLLYGGYIFYRQDIVTGIWCVSIGIILARMLATSEGRMLVDQRAKRGAVEEVMSRDFILIPPSMKLTKFFDDVLKNNRFTSFPVVVERRLHGMLFLEDLKPIPPERWDQTSVQDVMRPVDDSMFLMAGVSIDEARNLLKMNKLGRAAVLNAAGLIIGYVSLGDVK